MGAEIERDKVEKKEERKISWNDINMDIYT